MRDGLRTFKRMQLYCRFCLAGRVGTRTPRLRDQTVRYLPDTPIVSTKLNGHAGPNDDVVLIKTFATHKSAEKRAEQSERFFACWF